MVMQNLGPGKQDVLWSMWKYPESLKPRATAGILKKEHATPGKSLQSGYR